VLQVSKLRGQTTVDWKALPEDGEDATRNVRLASRE